MTALGIGVGVSFGGHPASLSNFQLAMGLIPSSGLTNQWLFEEGTGTSVADATGSSPINLNLPTTPNFTWNSGSIDLAAGLVQTPSITGCRTVAFLEKTTRGNAAGFELSGGATSGDGLLGAFTPTNSTIYAGSGQSAHAVYCRPGFSGAFELNREGWRLVVRVMSSAFTTPWGFGGRYGTTTSRVANFSIAWAACWNRALTTDEIASLYTAMRYWSKWKTQNGRAIYIDARDCPTLVDGVILWGQSNAQGKAPITGLSAGDQAQTWVKTFIQSGAWATSSYPPAQLILGTNNDPTLAGDFGPEFGMGQSRELSAKTTPLYICKTAKGSTWLESSATEPAVIGLTWNSGELTTQTGLYQNALLDWYDMQQWGLLNSIGINLRGLAWMQGEQDATDATAAADYQTNLTALAVAIRTFTGYTSLPTAIALISPGLDATEVYASVVQAAETAFVAGDANAVLVQTSDLTQIPGNAPHFDAPGQKALGQRFYTALAL